MRRLVLACLVIAFAAAPAAHAQAPSGDAVTGTPSVGFGMGGTWSFAIDAHGGPSGESPSGRISASNFLLGTLEFSVTCLTVSGNRAAVLGRWIAPSPPPPPPPPGFSYPTLIQMEVLDGGGTGQDRLAFTIRDFPFPTPGPPPTDCPTSTAALEPLRAGDVAVTDARAASDLQGPLQERRLA